MWVMVSVHPVQSTYVLRSLSTDTSCRCFLGYVNTEHHFPSDLHVVFHDFISLEMPHETGVWLCALLQKHVAKRYVCVGGITAPFCSTYHPLPIPVLSKLGLDISWHGVAASRILITAPFSRYYIQQWQVLNNGHTASKVQPELMLLQSWPRLGWWPFTVHRGALGPYYNNG